MNPILITGGAKGLGAEISRTLSLQGHDIIIHYRQSEKEAVSLSKECQKRGVESIHIQGDFCSIEGLETFVDRIKSQFPRIKGVVNNVGNYLIAPPSETMSLDWRALFQTNFFAPIDLIHALLPQLKQAKGTIINIGTSGLTAARALLHATAYASSKSALLFYTRSLAKELAAHHVTVNMVSPGFLENAIDLDEKTKLPMKRAATLKEAAQLVAFLFDPDNHYITGQNIEIAGGFGL